MPPKKTQVTQAMPLRQVSLSDLLLLASSGASLFLIAISYLGRSGKKPRDTREARTTAPEKPVEEENWLEAVTPLLGRKLEGVKPVRPKGLEWKTVRLHRGVVPRGYEGGPWRIALLGCGGWGCVFLGEDTTRGLRVAFKVPKSFKDAFLRGSIPTVLEKEVEEVAKRAKTLASLHHPHILRLLGWSEASPVLVYEYADYGTLEDQLSAGWKPRPRDIPLLGVQLGDALRYLHTRGLVHSDIKPSNIFLVDRVAKLGDFSSQVSLAEQAGKTGYYTPGWRAPEQASPELYSKAASLGVENRVDIYQLGNLLQYLATGEAIDGAETGEEEKKEILAKIPDQQLREILASMLAKEPWKRPSSEEVVKKLVKLAHHS